MKQLVILSGKGGTGKTTIAGAFIKLAKARAYADCDVDAPQFALDQCLERGAGKKQIITVCPKPSSIRRYV